MYIITAAFFNSQVPCYPFFRRIRGLPIFEAFVGFLVTSCWSLIMKSLQYWSAWGTVHRSSHLPRERGWCIQGTVESAVSPGLSSAYCLVLWGYPFGGKCPFLQRLCLSPSTPFPFVGSFYSLHVCANVFLFHGYDFCNICCLSHRRVCRVANCFIGNFWWGMI